MLRPLYRVFFRDIPEAKYLFDIDQMIKNGLAFNYTAVSSEMIDWREMPNARASSSWLSLRDLRESLTRFSIDISFSSILAVLFPFAPLNFVRGATEGLYELNNFIVHKENVK